jgi:hypothetical protein
MAECDGVSGGESLGIRAPTVALLNLNVTHDVADQSIMLAERLLPWRIR